MQTLFMLADADTREAGPAEHAPQRLATNGPLAAMWCANALVILQSDGLCDSVSPIPRRVTNESKSKYKFSLVEPKL